MLANRHQSKTREPIIESSQYVLVPILVLAVNLMGIVSTALSHIGMWREHPEYLVVLRLFLDAELVLA